MNDHKLNSVQVPIPYDMWCYLNNLAGILNIEVHNVILELCELGKATAETIITKNNLNETKLLQSITAQASLESLLLLRSITQITPEARQTASQEAKNILRSTLTEKQC